jgi:hypothetical protein
VLHLPHERKLLKLKADAEKSIWILKPQASSCGRGIRLVTRDTLHTILPTKKAVVQRYLHQPHLILGVKYDLRLYVAVTSFDPLKVYLFAHGLVRFSTAKYTLNNLTSRFAHLTNYSINKKSAKFVEHPDDEAEAETGGVAGSGAAGGSEGGKEAAEPGVRAAGVPAGGHKWPLAALWKHLEEEVGAARVAQLRREISNLVVKTLIAADSEVSPQCLCVL